MPHVRRRAANKKYSNKVVLSSSCHGFRGSIAYSYHLAERASCTLCRINTVNSMRCIMQIEISIIFSHTSHKWSFWQSWLFYHVFVREFICGHYEIEVIFQQLWLDFLAETGSGAAATRCLDHLQYEYTGLLDRLFWQSSSVAKLTSWNYW